MPEPYKWLTESAQRLVLLISFLLSLTLLTAMHSLDHALITQTAPRGIISFELAGSTEKVSQILNEWGPEGKAYATLSLGLDYLFLIVYALFLSLSCVRIAKHLKSRFPYAAAWGFVLGWAQFIAALLDAIENFSLIKLALDYQPKSWPEIARWCAVSKFGIVGVGLVYILIGVSLILVLKVLDSRGS